MRARTSRPYAPRAGSRTSEEALCVRRFVSLASGRNSTECSARSARKDRSEPRDAHRTLAATASVPFIEIHRSRRVHVDPPFLQTPCRRASMSMQRHAPALRRARRQCQRDSRTVSGENRPRGRRFFRKNYRKRPAIAALHQCNARCPWHADDAIVDGPFAHAYNEDARRSARMLLPRFRHALETLPNRI